MQVNRDKIIFYLIFICIASFFILFAYNGYPLLGGDSYCFGPTAIHLDKGDGLINEIYAPTGKQEMLFYPPLFPYFQSLLLFTNKPNELFISYSITSILALFFMMNVVWKLLSNTTSSSIKFILLFVISIGIASGLDISSGRPEILINLLVSIGLFIFISNFKYEDYFYGILLALIGITSVVTSVYVFLILLLIYSYNKKKIYNYIKVAISSAFVFIVFLVVYPYNFIELIQTMQAEAQKIVFARNDVYSFKEFINYHIIYPSYTFYFLLFFSSLIFIISKVYTSAWQLILLTAVLFFIIYFGFRNLATNYYVYNIYLVYVTITISWFVKHRYNALLVFLFALSSIGFVRRSALFFYYFDESAVVNTVNKTLLNYNIQNYSDNASFWVFNYYRNSTPNTNLQFNIYQQVYSAGFMLNKNEIIEKKFTNNKPFRLFGLTIANNPPFYYYTLTKEEQQ